MLDNNKILNLTDVDDDDFEAIKEAIKDWKSSGYPGKFLFVTEKEAQESIETVKRVYQDVYNKGVWRGGLALAAGIAVGTMIHFGIEQFKAKQKKEVEEAQ